MSFAVTLGSCRLRTHRLKPRLLFALFAFVGVTLYHPVAAWAQDVGAYASLNGGPSALAKAGPRATLVRKASLNGYYMSCVGQGVSTYEDPTINLTVSLSGPSGQIAYQQGLGSGFLQVNVDGYSVPSPDDQPYFCQVYAWNGYASASASASATIPGDDTPWSIQQGATEFEQHVGPGNYLKKVLFQFQTPQSQPYQHSSSVSEDFYVAGGQNSCNLTINQRDGETNDQGEFGDAYGNWHLSDPSQPDMTFTCPVPSCNSYFIQTIDFSAHRWSHTVNYSCTDVTWSPYGARFQ